MLPIHRAKSSVFNYEEIPAGYYYQAMLEGSPVQRFWHREKFREVANRIEDGSQVLDFGCGPGSFLSVLGEEKKNVKAVGVDIASRQIDFAMANIAVNYRDGRISFRKLNAGEVRLPYEDNSFDVVTSIEVIEHIHPYLAYKILEEAKRVLKPGGRIIVTTPNYRSLWPFIEFGLEHLSPVKYHEQHISKFTPNSIVKFMEGVGLEVTRINTIFVLAPFLASLSKGLANTLHRMESRFNMRLGSLLVLESKKLDEKTLLA